MIEIQIQLFVYKQLEDKSISLNYPQCDEVKESNENTTWNVWAECQACFHFLKKYKNHHDRKKYDNSDVSFCLIACILCK